MSGSPGKVKHEKQMNGSSSHSSARTTPGYSKEANQMFNDTLDGLSLRTPATPYRALIIDADERFAGEYAALLEDVGISSNLLTDPRQVLVAVSDFKPDIIIADTDMPGFSGPELVATLRQDNDYVELPVIFLFDDTDSGRQPAVPGLAGVDCMTRPVNPAHFSAVVMARVKQARHVNRLVEGLRKALKEKECRLSAMEHHAIVSTADAAGTITYVNAKFCETSGYRPDELLGKNHRIVKSNYHPSEYYEELWSTISDGKVWQGELCNQRKDGSQYWVESTIVPFLDDDGLPCQYVAVRTDISNLKKTEAELIIAKEEAEKTSRAKSDFLSSMSHELRTPMNAILGFAQLLEVESDRALTHLQQESVHEILKAGHHLLVLIDGVLDLAKVEAGHLDVSIEPVGLYDVCQECMKIITPLARSRDINITWDEERFRNLVVRADRTRIKQVLLNLLSNAVKYNREKGSVTIYCAHLDTGQLRIEVSDTGAGISAERQVELFKPFSRLGAENGVVEGTGIGLHISRQLIELMEGRIGVESEPGIGSTFWIELVSDSIPDVETTGTEYMDYTSSPNRLPEALSTVLYVEDNPANLKLVSKLFMKLTSARLYTAHTPALGLELAKVHRPDLILLDIQLPGMDGYEILRRLRAQDDTRHIPVVAMTANAMPKDIERGLSEGFDEYLTKPINVPRFFETMERILATRLTSEGKQ